MLPLGLFQQIWPWKGADSRAGGSCSARMESREELCHVLNRSAPGFPNGSHPKLSHPWSQRAIRPHPAPLHFLLAIFKAELMEVPTPHPPSPRIPGYRVGAGMRWDAMGCGGARMLGACPPLHHAGMPFVLLGVGGNSAALGFSLLFWKPKTFTERPTRALPATERGTWLTPLLSLAASPSPSCLGGRGFSLPLPPLFSLFLTFFLWYKLGKTTPSCGNDRGGQKADPRSSMVMPAPDSPSC